MLPCGWRSFNGALMGNRTIGRLPTINEILGRQEALSVGRVRDQESGVRSLMETLGMRETMCQRVGLWAVMFTAWIYGSVLGTLPGLAETKPEIFESRSLVGSYLAGRLARNNNDTSNAAKFYGSALVRDPRNTVLLDQAFTMELTGGNWKRALRLAELLIVEQPKHRMAQLLLGLQDFKNKNFRSAEEHVKASALGPIGELSSALTLAWVRESIKKHDLALQALKLDNKADWAQYYLRYHRALLLDVAGRSSGASKAFAEVFKQDSRTLRSTLAYAHHAAVVRGKPAARRILRQHQAKTKADQHALVRDFLSRLDDGSRIDLLVKTPTDGIVEVLYGLGEALAGEGGLTPGMLYLQMALYLSPDHPFALAALANAFETMRLFSEANEVYERIPDNTPLHTAIQIRRAFNLNSLDEVDDARNTLVALLETEAGGSNAANDKATARLEKLLAAGPGNGDVLSVGSNADQVRTVQQALSSLDIDVGEVDGVYGEATRRGVARFQKENGLDVDGVVGPQTYESLVRAAGPLTYDNRVDSITQLQILDAIGNILRARKKYGEAIGYYDKAIALIKKPRKRDWVYFYARGTCHEREKNWPKAEADLKAALKLVPDQPLVLNYLGYSWIDQGLNLKEGLKLIERAVALKPDDGYVVDSLGWAHFKLGNIKQAVLFLERAVELRPDDPILNDHLGDALWRAGRQREARFQWEQALTLKPEPEDATKIRAKIRKGLLVPVDAPALQSATNASTDPAVSRDSRN